MSAVPPTTSTQTTQTPTTEVVDSALLKVKAKAALFVPHITDQAAALARIEAPKQVTFSKSALSSPKGEGKYDTAPQDEPPVIRGPTSRQPLHELDSARAEVAEEGLPLPRELYKDLVDVVAARILHGTRIVHPGLLSLPHSQLESHLIISLQAVRRLLTAWDSDEPDAVEPPNHEMCGYVEQSTWERAIDDEVSKVLNQQAVAANFRDDSEELIQAFRADAH